MNQTEITKRGEVIWLEMPLSGLLLEKVLYIIAHFTTSSLEEASSVSNGGVDMRVLNKLLEDCRKGVRRRTPSFSAALLVTVKCPERAVSDKLSYCLFNLGEVFLTFNTEVKSRSRHPGPYNRDFIGRGNFRDLSVCSTEEPRNWFNRFSLSDFDNDALEYAVAHAALQNSFWGHRRKYGPPLEALMPVVRKVAAA